jgi:hypothetical protein
MPNHGPGQHLDPGHQRLNRDAVLLDELGASAVAIDGQEETPALVVDLGGRLNKTDARVTHRYLMPVGMAAELVANVVVAAQIAGGAFADDLERAIAAEQARIAGADRPAD